MPNALKGEVAFVAGETTYTLALTTNAIVEVETVCGGEDIATIIQRWQAAPSLTTLRTLLWGALRTHHDGLSLLDVGNLIDEVGPNGMEALGEALGQVIRFRLSGPETAPAGKPAGRKR